MAKRNTIQRQLVIAAVRFLADHPTAEEVYDRITMEYPRYQQRYRLPQP